MAARTLDWRDELGRWLKPFLARLGHKARRQMCPLYVSGLIGPGDRKSVQPMAKRLALGACDQLHHFIAAGVRDAGPSETELLVQADKLVGGSDAVLVIDDTAIPKKGTHSVGVAAQYASALGKTANCQTLVSLTLARGEVPVVLSVAAVSCRELDEGADTVGTSGCSGRVSNGADEARVGFGGDRSCDRGRRALRLRLADAGYGLSAPFRQALTARKLAWAVGIPRHLKVYSADVQMVWPVAKRGRPRQRHVPDVLSIPAEDMLAHAKWHTIVGVPAPRESSRRVLLRFACESPTDHRSRSGTRGNSISPGKRLGSSANTVRRGRKNTISPTCRRRPTCAPWRQPSRHDGFASRLISN